MIVLVIDTLIEHVQCPRGTEQWPETEWNAGDLVAEQEDIFGD